MEVASCVKAPRRFGKAFAPRRTPLPFRSLDRTGLLALKQGLQMMKKIRVEEIKPIRLCAQFHLTGSLAVHFLRPN
jgi:hypothetical protein